MLFLFNVTFSLNADDSMILLPFGWEELSKEIERASSINFEWNEIQKKDIVKKDDTKVSVLIDDVPLLLTFPDSFSADKWISETSNRATYIYFLSSKDSIMYEIDDWIIQFFETEGSVFAPYDGSMLAMGFLETFNVFSVYWNGFEVGMTGFNEELTVKESYKKGEIIGPIDSKITISLLNINNPNIDNEFIPVFVRTMDKD